MLADDVAFLLQDFGSDLTLVRQTPVAYDPATGTNGPAVTTTYPIRGVFINYTDDDLANSAISMGDRRLLLQAKDAVTAPQPGDRVDGLQVLDVRTYAPNGIAVAWACQMRK